MTEGPDYVHPDSPHARMVKFLAESDRVLRERCTSHDPKTVGSWPSGPDGETDSLEVCRNCGATSIRADGRDDEEGVGMRIPEARTGEWDEEPDHPEFGHMMLVWWDETGRMQWKDKGRRCEKEGHSHFPDATVRVVRAKQTGLPFIPEGAVSWTVWAGAPTAEDARDVAFTVGKALGATLNPVQVGE